MGHAPPRPASPGRPSISLPRARRELRRAHRLASMPVLAEAVADGRLSMDHVDLLADADIATRHEAFVRDEAMLVDHCQQLRFAQAVHALGYWKLRVDATGDGDDDGQPPADTAAVHASTMVDGVIRLDGHLDPLGGATFLTELTPDAPADLADEPPGSHVPPHNVTPRRHCSPSCWADDSFARLCELATGTIIAPRQLVPYLDTALLETILFADPLTAVGISPQRTFKGRLRRAVEVRTRHCEHPSGCDEPITRCDVDHITPHSNGGVTSQFNGRLECRPHDRDHTLHDHHAQPLPEREITSVDRLRVILRWRLEHEHPDEWAWLTGETPDESDAA